MDARDFSNIQVYKLLCEIDQGYKPGKEQVTKLKQRQVLDLRDTNVSYIPKSIGMLTNLRSINLHGLKIKSLPGSIGELTRISEMNLRGTDISSLPKSFYRLHSLQTLNLSVSSITTLPDFSLMDKLQEIDLRGTKIDRLPKSIKDLHSLRILNLRGSTIKSIPEAIGFLESLEDLNLCATHISSLPKSLANLKNLKWLDISQTAIDVLPENIGELPKLQSLNLAGLVIQKIPKSLALKGLPFCIDKSFSYWKSGINLFNVTLVKQDKSIFVESPELIHSLYEDQIRIPECRILFLGDGDSGKTYTIRRIQNNGRRETKECPYLTQQTPGVEIADWHAVRSEGDLDIHFWDFGGQEILHSMHRCFLTDQTCYVVTVKSRETKGTQRARYWLRNVTAFAPNSPILLFVNCWDNDDGARCIDEPLLRMEYPNIKHVVYVSAKEASDLYFSEKLMKPLICMAADSEACNRTINRHWDTVRQAIIEESKTKHYLTRTRYHQLCIESQIEDEDAPALLTYFNALGVCFSYHREGNNNLKNYKLLNPVWLTNAVYAIIEEGMAYAQEGRISLSSIEQMLGNREPEKLIVIDSLGKETIRPYRRTMPGIVYQKLECQYIIDVASARNLCYREADKTLFFPALCTNNTPAEALSNPKEYPKHIEYLLQYSYLPDSVIHQLVIRCRKADLTINHCWLRGMILGSMDAHKAIIRMDGDEGLRIEIWSKLNRSAYELFELIRREILAVNSNLGLTAQEFIVEGKCEKTIEELLAAAQAKKTVYWCKKWIAAEELLGRFYENWTLNFMRVEEDGVITVPIIPRVFHPYSKNNQFLRKALYHAYGGYCQYCGQLISDIREMQVDHILPRDYVTLPELTEYIRYLEQQGFKTDCVENYFPAHGHCNREKSNNVDPFALLARHERAGIKAVTVLRLMEKGKKSSE